MATQIDRDASSILRLLAGAPRDEYVEAAEVAGQSGLSPERVSDAVALLVDAGYAEWIQTMGTAPYDFMAVTITARGRYEDQRLADASVAALVKAPEGVGSGPEAGAFESTTSAVSLPPLPIGSPYGFNDADWETVSERKGQPGTLFVVLGHQFVSEYFATPSLRTNVEAMLGRAIDAYNVMPARQHLTLDFRALNAGYGEHLFNEIARDVIGSDIAVFETSDLNPNVMIEMGVALTWGVRVLPIKREGQSKPPSDISGQTWADYREDGATFLDPDHDDKLVRMIDRAIRKKVNAAGRR